MSSKEQNNISKIKSQNGKESWEGLLKDLYSASLGIPEDWTQETSAHWSSDHQSLIVTVPSSADDDWINRRFLPIANILFQEKHKEKRLVIQKKGEGKPNELLVKVHKDAYEHVVRPRRMIPVPFYLLHHWLTVLGAAPFWVVIALIQQSFVNTVNKEKENSVQKRISTRELSYWAPLSYRQISRYLNKEGFSGWFYKKEKEGYQDVPPEYKVWSQLPIAPHHLAWVDNYFRDSKKGEPAVSLIESLLDKTGDIRRVKFGDIDIPESFASKRMSLLDIVLGHYPGEQDPLIYDLVTQLEHQVIRPNLFLSIPHYFFEKYGGVLKPNEAALIWYLRSLYKDDDSDSFSFSGYSQLCSSLGCSSMTVRRLLASCAPADDEPVSSSWNYSFVDDPVLRNWLSVLHISHNNNGSADKYTIGVRATEPIHQEDNDIYSQMVEDLLSIARDNDENPQPSQNVPQGEEGTDSQPSQTVPPNEEVSDPQPSQSVPPKEEALEFQPSQTVTQPLQKGTPPSHNDTLPSQNITPNLNNTSHLKSSYKGSLNTSLNASLIPPLPSSADQATQNRSKVVGVREINLDKLLGFESYKHNEKKNLADIITKDQELFLAWIIRNHITAADFPARLAVKNIRDGNVTEEHYLEIAKLGWGIVAEMVRVNENDMDLWKMGIFDDIEGSEYLAEIFRKLSKPAGKVIKNLKETEFILMVENVLLDEGE